MLPLALLAAGFNTSSDELVREVVTGHRATLDSIRTFSAAVSFADANTAMFAKSARYLRDVERVSIQDGTPGHQLTSLLLEPGQIRQLSRSWVGTKGQKLNSPRVVGCVWGLNEDLGGIDLWRELILSFRTRANRTDQLGVAVAMPEANASALRETVDGRPMIRLNYTYYQTPETAWRVTLWHDPAKGYLVVRRDMKDVQGKWPGSRTEVTDFVSAGVEFPTKATLTSSRPSDGIAITQTTTVSDVQINRPLPAGTFDLPLPAGTRITDDVRKSEYVAGPDWKPTGPEKPWSRAAIVPPAVPADTPTRQSATEERRGWAGWLTLAAAILLVLVGAALLVRRIARGRNDATT